MLCFVLNKIISIVAKPRSCVILLLLFISCANSKYSIQNDLVIYHLDKAADVVLGIYKNESQNTAINALKVFVALIPSQDDPLHEMIKDKALQSVYVHYGITMHGRLGKLYSQSGCDLQADEEIKIALQIAKTESDRWAQMGVKEKWLLRLKDKESIFSFIEQCDKSGLP